MQKKESITNNPLQDYLDAIDETTCTFARRTGIPATTLYAILKNSRKPYRRTVMRICRHTKGMLTPQDFGYDLHKVGT